MGAVGTSAWTRWHHVPQERWNPSPLPRSRRNPAVPSTAGVNIQPVPVSCPVPAPGLIKLHVRGRHHTELSTTKGRRKPRNKLER